MCLSRHFHYSGFHQYTTVDSISPSFSKSGSKVGTLGGTAGELDKALSVEGFWLPVVKKSLEMSFPVTPSHSQRHMHNFCVFVCVCVCTNTQPQLWFGTQLQRALHKNCAAGTRRGSLIQNTLHSRAQSVPRCLVWGNETVITQVNEAGIHRVCGVAPHKPIITHFHGERKKATHLQ